MTRTIHEWPQHCAGVPHAGTFRFAILGAGCAGLSLCRELLARGVTDPILVLDRRPTLTGDDRTWCFWDVEGSEWGRHAARRWGAWDVRAGGRSARPSCPSAPYTLLHGSDFVRACVADITAHANVTLRLGTRVFGLEERDGGVRIATDRGGFRAEVVADALALGSPRFPVSGPRDVTLWQQFLGQWVRADEDVFDPSVVTLMDFDVPGPRPGDAVRFVYVLPVSPREALIEHTVFVPRKDAAPSDDEHQAAVTAYAAARWGRPPLTVVREEKGIIPMSTRRFLSAEGRVVRVGTAGGASRASSGYTFLRIQRQAAAVAGTLAAGGDAHAAACVAADPALLDALDAVFLTALRRDPRAVPEYFLRLFAGTPPDALVRFLSETGTATDTARVLAALPKAPFVRAALDAAPLLVGRLFGGRGGA